MRIAVLGGGVTGLTAAWKLGRKGHDCVVFEGGDRPGGLCRSETIDGYVVDHAGGHIIFSTDREVLDFMLSVLGPGGAVKSERRARIFHHDRWVTYPFENGLGDLTPEHRYDCLKGYVEAWHARKTGAEEPRDFKAWCLWRFGEGICRHFMWPYNEKIWNVDLARLGTAWVRGRVPDAPVDDVLKAAAGIPTLGYGHQAVFWYPSSGGFESVIRGILAALERTEVRCATRVETVRRDADGFTVNGERFDRVISTIPLPELVRTLGDVPESVASATAGLSFTSLTTVFIALADATVPDLSWVYFPHPDDGPQNRVTFISNYAPANAPAGGASVMAEVTHIGPCPGGTAKTARDVVGGLVHRGIIRAENVKFTKTFSNPYAYILYEDGVEGRIDAVRAFAASRGVDTVGRFGNYNYYNSDRCIRAAFDLAASYPDA